MDLSVKRNNDFQGERLIKSSDNLLSINCEKCKNLEKDIYKDNCISCVSEFLYKNQKRKIYSIQLETFNSIVNKNKISFFLEYHDFLERIKKILKKIRNQRNKCYYNDLKCPIFSEALHNLNKKIDLYNPISFYKLIRDYNSNLINIKTKNQCLKCFLKISENLKYLNSILSNLRIINKYNNFNKKRDLFKNYSNFYEYFFSDIFISKEKKPIFLTNILKKWKLIKSYDIEKYNLYRCDIFKIKNEVENIYTIKIFFEKSSKNDFYNGILNDTYNHLRLANINQIISIEKLIDFYHNEAVKFIDQKYRLSNINKHSIGLLVAIKIINLEKIFPLLIDDYIEEIFLDSPLEKIYINHQKFGRCRTLITLKVQEIERLKTLFRLYSGQRLDHSNPSIKLVIKNKFFYCRFAVDIKPINFQDFSLDIRKLNKNIFTIQDLLKNNTLNPKMTAFLYLCILKQVNITVTGTTDSGKTTLINALDLLAPKEFRKIYVENVVESLDEIEFGKHQLKYKVDSSEDLVKSINTKSGLIKKLLHRTPDLIYLGEILTEEESKAMFHCLAAGLKGFQTIHANDIDSLINRFIYHFQINKVCLNDLDLIILMKKNRNNSRKVFSINEIVLNDGKVTFYPIFQFNPKRNDWDQLKSLYSTKIIKKLAKFEYQNKEDFECLIEIYTKIFSFLGNEKKFRNVKLIKFFDKISYISYDSTSHLEEYLHKMLSSQKNMTPVRNK